MQLNLLGGLTYKYGIVLKPVHSMSLRLIARHEDHQLQAANLTVKFEDELVSFATISVFLGSQAHRFCVLQYKTVTWPPLWLPALHVCLICTGKASLQINAWWLWNYTLWLWPEFCAYGRKNAKRKLLGLEPMHTTANLRASLSFPLWKKETFYIYTYLLSVISEIHSVMADKVKYIYIAYMYVSIQVNFTLLL
jgi:hypothetical protein